MATTKMFLTKYALTTGIEEVQAEPWATDDRYARAKGYTLLKIGRDIHHTLEGAKADAEKRRTAKIKSLEKQIASLKAKKF